MKKDELTALERVALTLQHKEADRVPVYPIVCGAARQLIGVDYEEWTKNIDATYEAFVKVTETLGLDCIVTLIDLSLEAADFGQEVIYNKNEAAHPNMNNRLIKSIDDYENLQPVNFKKATRMNSHIDLCNRLVKNKGKEYPVVAFVFAPLGVLSMLRGQEQMFMDLIMAPDAVKKGLEVVTASLKEYCGKLVETGVNAIMLDTLFASKSIMSEAMWEEFEGPYVKELCDFVRKKNQDTMIMLHNCGKGLYLDAQIKYMDPIAVSFLHLPPDCETEQELKEKYGKDITLIGAIDPPWISRASEEEVRKEAMRQIDIYAKGGGYILATGCEYPANSSLRNAEVMVEVAKAYGRYGKKESLVG